MFSIDIIIYSVHTHSLHAPVLCFVFSLNDGSKKTKHVAEFLILITNIYCCVY